MSSAYLFNGCIMISFDYSPWANQHSCLSALRVRTRWKSLGFLGRDENGRSYLVIQATVTETVCWERQTEKGTRRGYGKTEQTDQSTTRAARRHTGWKGVRLLTLWLLAVSCKPSTRCLGNLYAQWWWVCRIRIRTGYNIWQVAHSVKNPPAM